MSLKNKKPDIRRLSDMKDVVYDKEWLKKAPDLELYFMYRGLKERDGLRYDVTVIPARMLGQEYVKTKGHEHIGSYQEIYTVLEGEAIFFMQKGKEKIKDAIAIRAEKGESAVIPPDYAHITVNPSEKDLKMANWMAKEAKSDYSFIQKMGGGCYFYTAKGWIKNVNYSEVPEIRLQSPLESVPENLEFLKKG